MEESRMITLVKYVLIAILVFIINVILVAFELYWIADMFTPMIIIICTGIIVHHIKQSNR